MKNIFITYLVFSIFYLIFSNTLLDMGGNIATGMRKRLRYLMPPQLQSLIVRALVLSIPRTLNWKTGNKNKAPINQGLYHSGIFLSDIPCLNVLLVLQKLLILPGQVRLATASPLAEQHLT